MNAHELLFASYDYLDSRGEREQWERQNCTINGNHVRLVEVRRAGVIMDEHVLPVGE